jgi:hypothetical protein
MNWYEWVLIIVELPVVWFIWTALHELSHIIDLFVGSLGISPYSDLRRAAESLNINPYILRIIGFVLITLSIISGFII